MSVSIQGSKVSELFKVCAATFMMDFYLAVYTQASLEGKCV